MRRFVSVSIALAFGILSPYAACQLLPVFHYDAAEMRVAVEGTWKLDADSRTVVFTVEQATDADRHASTAWLSSATACSDDRRTLVKTAGACGGDVVKTEMPLVITALGGATGNSNGDFIVHGYRFHSGEMQVAIAGWVVHAIVDPDGHVTSTKAWDANHQPLPVTLTRTSDRR